MGRSISLCSALSLLMLGNVASVSATAWFNWQYGTTCQSTGSYTPLDDANLVQFVKGQAESKTFLKAVGTLGCFGNLTTCINDADTDRYSYLVSITNLRDFSVGENNTATFGAVWDLVDLVPELLAHSLQLLSGPSQSVHNSVGAATASTHGSGKNLGNMASYITGVRVVDAAGKVHVYEETTSDYLKAFKISLGAWV
jgi:L-gulono-1,4-lactone dehydrogenase